jgi:hypothetical protein
MTVDNTSLGRPVGVNFGKYLLDDPVTFGVHRASFIGPHRQDAARFQNAACRVKKKLDVEPVERLRNGDQVDRIGIEPRRFGRCDAKIYVSMWSGRRDLLLARVCCQDLFEKRGKGPRRLAVAGGTVPGQRMLVTKCCEECE